MNNLSWLLYWADVLPSFAQGVALLSLLGIIFTTFGFVGWVMSKAVEEEAATKALAPTTWLLPLFIVVTCLTNLVPSRETFYAIAASEVGEDVLKSPEATKARKAINNWLDKQLETEETTDDADDTTA